MLFVITAISLTAAVVCGGLLWRAVLNDRKRSAARVAALGEAIDAADPRTGASGTASPSPLFAADRRSVMQGRPLLKVAIGFAMAVAVIVLIAMTGGRSRVAEPAKAATSRPSPLELISMRHTRSDDRLTVTGLVRNPGSAATDRLVAVVLAFDRNGDFVASGRAPLELGRLSGGDESPFQVTIPQVTDVGRYRVSFRSESGTVRHVDKRQPAAAASVSSHGGGL